MHNVVKPLFLLFSCFLLFDSSLFRAHMHNPFMSLFSYDFFHLESMHNVVTPLFFLFSCCRIVSFQCIYTQPIDKPFSYLFCCYVVIVSTHNPFIGLFSIYEEYNTRRSVFIGLFSIYKEYNTHRSVFMYPVQHRSLFHI